MRTTRRRYPNSSWNGVEKPKEMNFRNVGLGLVIAILLIAQARAAEPVTATLTPALGWDSTTQGAFVECVTADAGGNVWVGTEGNGVWKYDAAKKTWTQFTTKDGLGGDHVYSIAVDQQNRVWAGLLNRGVSVYNGVQWRTYGALDGPLGNHVFAIAVCPSDGDVWMGTDLGLARYSEKRKDWDYYTRASGLPSDQIQCLAFDKNGKIYVGTQCNGIATAAPDDDYLTWHTITAPDHLPAAPFGDGLASDQINCILNLESADSNSSAALAGTPLGGTVIVGDVLKFNRGEDWRDHTPGPYQNSPRPPGPYPLEDWITALAQSGTHVWVGYRTAGVECDNIAGQGSREITANVSGTTDISGTDGIMVRGILALPDHPPLFAAYDTLLGGLLTTDGSAAWQPLNGAQTGTPPQPAPAPAPAPDEAKTLISRLQKVADPLQPGEAFYLADDWRTKGDWAGHYGTAYTMLCSIADANKDMGLNATDEDYALEQGYAAEVDLGPNHDPNSKVPDTFQHDDNAADISSLYSLELQHRRDAAVNDLDVNQTPYPESHPGPDLWVHVTVPEGVQCLSLYFRNYAAHGYFRNKSLDFDLCVVPDDPDPAKVQAAPPLARARVNDFWGGVYKQFLVCGPGKFVVKIGRNRSFMTKLQGVFIDRVTGQPQSAPAQLPGFDTVHYQLPDEPGPYQPTPLTAAATDLWDALDQSLGLRGAVPLQMPFHLWCYRAAVAGKAPAALLDRWCWELGIWTDTDRQKFYRVMDAAHNAAQ